MRTALGRVLLAAVLVWASTAAAQAAQPRFVPASGATWQWQLTTPIDLSVPAEVYDIDGFDSSAAVVAKLHRLGRHAICYLDAGSYEDYRSDAERFPEAVLGKGNVPWDGERWLDVRRLDILLPIMRDRIAMCARKGFDAVELDDVDGYSNDTGLPLTAADQLAYNRALAREVHRHGMSVALKNDLDQVPSLLGSFDFAINEECATYDECRTLSPFVRRGSAVFHVEYGRSRARFCSKTAALGLSSLRKRLDLGRYRELCAPAPGARVLSAQASGGRLVAEVGCPLARACRARIELRAGGVALAHRTERIAPRRHTRLTFALPARLGAAVRARSGAVVVVACRPIGRGCAVTGRAEVAAA